MSCSCAKSDGNGRYTCDVTGDGCMFYIPDSKRCMEEYGEGPDACSGTSGLDQQESEEAYDKHMSDDTPPEPEEDE